MEQSFNRFPFVGGHRCADNSCCANFIPLINTIIGLVFFYMMIGMADRVPENGDGVVTDLLHRASMGDQAAAHELPRILERELRQLASLHMRRERKNHTLQTTAVMNEAFLRMTGRQTGQCQNRQHFLAMASRVMREVLVDYARARQAEKRQNSSVSLHLVDPSIGPIPTQVLDVHEALADFALIAPRQAQLVELRFFGGLSLEEAAQVLGISPRTADKDWSLSRAWLRQRLGGIA
jgi:RNA polymerase sigma-70 factor (ECF subfamily)